MKKRWNILTADEGQVATLQQALKIHPALCRILVQRGILDFEGAKQFFRPDLKDLHDPFLMKDMEKAVSRISDAIARQEKILIFGDYDVDGTTSVASMFQFLQNIYSNDKLDFYIPHRYREGYGVSKAGIDYAKEQGFSLIISLDCGIKSASLIGYAKELGIDFIVCDHHLPDEILPPAFAILNPKQKDCPYPYKELCGCGVGFKLMTALSMRLNLPDELANGYLDLLATAIAADIVPLTGENRTMAFLGLKKVNENPNHGIKALCHLSGLKKEINIGNVVFMIAPRVNAAGRMDDARKAVGMFIADTYEQALHFAEMLHADNSERKEADSTITEEALAIIEASDNFTERRSTVVFQAHWHKGVVGIVASRLIEKYYRPTVVLTQNAGMVAGSARSVSGFNLYEAIHACRDHLLGYGGHFAAAGMTMNPENVEAFSSKFEEIVAATILPSSLIPEIQVDTEIGFRDIQPSLYHILLQMEPFGPLNLRPVFMCRGVTDTGYSKIVKDHHIRFSLKHDDIVLTGIGFNLADRFHLILQKKPMDVLFTIDENEWHNQKNLQLKIIDLRLSEN